MKKSLGTYGKLYRIGGDEFVAILFCDVPKLKEILVDFDDTINNWSGKLIDELSVSYGWVNQEEKPEASVRQLGTIAEQRMYEAKTMHYRKKGVDRRGQQDAHKALYQLYTKILKINISDDTYQIINMDMNEQTVEKGFAYKISEWLKAFGTSGQVHPDDLQEYLAITNLEYMKSYFAGNKTSLHVFYRRKYGDIFKQVMMEIIPASDYSDNNQSLYLYVKDIDK